MASALPSSGPVVELVVYKLKPEAAASFDQVQPQIVEELKKFPGFVSFKSTKALEDPTVYVDYVEWESLAQAKEAADKVMTDEAFQPLMQAIEKVVYFGHLHDFKP